MVLKIAVFGSAVGSKKEIEEKAYEIGKELAKQGCIVISGGCAGLPHAASKGAFENNGKTLAYSRGIDLEDHKNNDIFPSDVFSDYIFIPKDFKYADNKAICGKYRNVMTCADCDAGIIIGGRIGTLNEFTNLFDMKKVIGALKGSEGTADLIPQIIKDANKKGGTVVIEEDPVLLVKKVIEEVQR